MTNKQIMRNVRRWGWGAVSLLLVVALLLPTAHSAAAQAGEGEGSEPNASNIARHAEYAQVSSERTAEAVAIEWTTSYEVGIAGFNIVVAEGDGFVAVNDEFMPTTAIDSLDAQSYAATVQLPGDEFYIEHVAMNGESHRSGPYAVGESTGEIPVLQETDWATIRADSEALAKDREAKRILEINSMLDAVRGPAPAPDEPLFEQSAGVLGERNIFLPLVAGNHGNATAANVDAVDAVPGATINLLVKEEGVCRVTYDDVAATGVDLEGVPSAYLALTNQGVPVRIRMVAAQAWGSGAFFEFVCQGIDTLYTDENVYVLRVDRSKAFRTYQNLRAPDLTETAPTYYRETIRFEENNTFSYSSIYDTPWAWNYGNATPTKPVSFTYPLDDIDALSSSGPLPEIKTELWGFGPGAHHVVISINGTQVQDINFTGNVIQEISSPLDDGILQNGGNSVTWELPGDSGAQSDIVAFEAITVEYSRAFVARNGALSFEGDAKLFTVDGLPNDQVTVFSFHRNRLWKMDKDQVQTAPSANGYRATFFGWGEPAQYHVSADGSMATPTIEAGQGPEDITTGPYDFVIIAHPDFLDELPGGSDDLYDLAAVRTSEGYDVLIVNVLDIYAQFSHSIFDAQAIKDYITYAIQQMGAGHFLLVGDDTMDYHNYVDDDAVSFIPSLYAEAYPGQHFMPVDPLYTDIGEDMRMEAAIGRFPVKTQAELAQMVRKTLIYSDRTDLTGDDAYLNQGRSALFAADEHDPYGDYSGISTKQYAAHFPTDWQISDAFLEGSSVPVEKKNIIDTVNAGVGLVNYLGHSAMRRWGPGLFLATDVGSFRNTDKPTVLVQYGCFPSAYVLSSNSMSEEWVVTDKGGAAASIGAVGLTIVPSDEEIGREFSKRVTAPGMTIGMALVEAKQQITPSRARADVLLGMVLFGDPTLQVKP